MIFRPGEFYTLVAFVGTTLYVGLVHFEVMRFSHAAYLCIALMLVVRFLTIALNWKTKSFEALHGVPDAAAVAPSVDNVADVVGK
ncbi:MAG: hypothetical protein LBV12_12245 [Puniceicoccales bacterium]|jgi:uncharacterized membrane protein YeiH|nr:hypothetical protein [Puniceicoccales bacterium]